VVTQVVLSHPEARNRCFKS